MCCVRACADTDMVGVRPPRPRCWGLALAVLLLLGAASSAHARTLQQQPRKQRSAPVVSDSSLVTATPLVADGQQLTLAASGGSTTPPPPAPSTGASGSVQAISVDTNPARLAKYNNQQPAPARIIPMPKPGTATATIKAAAAKAASVRTAAASDGTVRAATTTEPYPSYLRGETCAMAYSETEPACLRSPDQNTIVCLYTGEHGGCLKGC